MRIRKSVWLGVAAVVLTCATWQFVSALGTAPTADFLAAGLKQQVDLRGCSLEYDYTVTYPGKKWANGKERRIRYSSVWTPRVLRIDAVIEEDSGAAGWLALDTRQLLYESDKGQSTLWEDYEGAKTAQITSGYPATELSADQLMEPVERCIFTEPMSSSIASGTVSSERESIDGHDCWRVDVSNTYRVWLDESIGFCPRALEYVYPDARRSTVIRFEDYQQVDGKVWFPMQQALEWSQDGGVTVEKVLSRVDAVHVGRPIARDRLTITFPSGTSVDDRVADMQYTVP